MAKANAGKLMTIEEFAATGEGPRRSVTCRVCKLRQQRPDVYEQIHAAWFVREWRAVPIERYLRAIGVTDITQHNISHHFARPTCTGPSGDTP